MKTEFDTIETIAEAAYLGGGCNAYITKNIFLKAELSYTTYSEFRIGLGAKF